LRSFRAPARTIIRAAPRELKRTDARTLTFALYKTDRSLRTIDPCSAPSDHFAAVH